MMNPQPKPCQTWTPKTHRPRGDSPDGLLAYTAVALDRVRPLGVGDGIE